MRVYRMKRIVIFLVTVALGLGIFGVHKSSYIEVILPSYARDDHIGSLQTRQNADGTSLDEHHPFPRPIGPFVQNELNLIARNDVGFEDKMDRIARLRQQRLEDSCLSSNLTKHQPPGFSISDIPSKPVLVASDVHKAIFCFTGDIYSEMWREILGSENLRSIYSYRRESIAYRMKYYYKFLVIQDPLIRLMDAYQYGLRSDEGHVFDVKNIDIKEDLIKISQKVRSDYGANGEANGDEGAYARFKDFATFLVQKIFLKDELHYIWERIHVMCSPCSVKYDYISRAETALKDVRYVTTKVASSLKEQSIPANIDTNGTVSQLAQFRNEFGSELLRRLVDGYEKDYEVFGYLKPKL